MVFLSHARPEDNVFTRWLALQLANEGYPLWCDLTKLLGGEAYRIRFRTRYTEFALALHLTVEFRKCFQEFQFR